MEDAAGHFVLGREHYGPAGRGGAGLQEPGISPDYIVWHTSHPIKPLSDGKGSDTISSRSGIVTGCESWTGFRTCASLRVTTPNSDPREPQDRRTPVSRLSTARQLCVETHAQVYQGNSFIQCSYVYQQVNNNSKLTYNTILSSTNCCLAYRIDHLLDPRR